MEPKASMIGRRGQIFALLVAAAAMGLGLSSYVVMAQQGKDSEKRFEDFDRKNFDSHGSTNIDNKFLPLNPGTQFIFRGATQEGGGLVPRRVVMTVTDLTKMIDGVRTVVVWEADYKAGEMEEAEISFYAQDKGGNVWYLGELTEKYEDGEWQGARAWLSGTAGARAGIKMWAEPQLGTPSYSQGYSPPPYFWTDRGKVDQVGQKTCVPAGCYQDVLVIAESSEEEGKEAEQLKYHAPGVGYVRVGWRGKREKTKESLELTEIVNLGPDALAKARAKALELEKRAYIYGHTPPAEPIPGK